MRRKSRPEAPAVRREANVRTETSARPFRRILRRKLSPVQIALVVCLVAALAVAIYVVRAHFVWQAYVRQAERAEQSGQTDADLYQAILRESQKQPASSP